MIMENTVRTISNGYGHALCNGLGFARAASRVSTMLRGASIAAMLAASAAGAQELPATDSVPAGSMPRVTRDRSGVEEIIVTAQRRSENLQDVPIAITALSARQLLSRGVDGVTDLTTAVPGLNFSNAGSSQLPRIRGIGAQISSAGNESPVAIYIDDVYYGAATTSLLKFNNIEQVSVLKGPQGTLFGRNATGGVIQIRTRDPEQDFSGNIRLGYGNLDTREAELYLTGGPTPGIAGDVAIYFNDQRKGFGTNLFNGDETNQRRDFAARSKWLIDAGERTQIRIIADYAKLDGNVTGQTPVKGSVFAFADPFTGGPFDTDTNVTTHQSSEQWGTSLQVNHEFDAFELISISAYRKAKTRKYVDFDATNVPLGEGGPSSRERQFSQEVRLSSIGEGPLKWVVGGYFFRGWANEDDFGRELNFDESTPELGFVFDDSRTISHQNSWSYAGFGQLSYDLSDKTTVTVGGRYTWEKKIYGGRHVYDDNGVGETPAPPPASGRMSGGKPTWRLSLDHHFNSGLLGYVSYNRGFKSGGFNLSNGEDPAESYKAETLDAYEIGLKSDFLDHRVRFNAAAFFYDYKNIQVNVYDLMTGFPKPQSGGPVKVYGLDADLTVAPTNHLTFTAGLSLNHSRFGDFPGAQFSVPSEMGGNESVPGNAKGNRLPNTADWTANAGVEYEIPLPRGSVLLAANYFHSNGYFGEVDNRLRQAPFDIINANLTWLVDAAGKYSVRLWGKNLTNTAYATLKFAGFLGDAQITAPGRTFGVSLGAKF